MAESEQVFSFSDFQLVFFLVYSISSNKNKTPKYTEVLSKYLIDEFFND